jgi:hypothetical protein
MPQNAASQPRPWVWTPTRTKAAVALAQDDQSDEQIARSLGIHWATLARMKLHPEFAQRVRELQNEYVRLFTDAVRVELQKQYSVMAGASRREPRPRGCR